MQFFKKYFTFSLLLLVLSVAAFLRLSNIPDSLMFQGDQGRDAMIVAQIFKENDPVFIGPVTSVGNMYLGPLYYYFMMPFLWLTYPNPVGPAYAVAILSILATWLMYRLGKEMVGTKAAMLGTILFAVSSTVIEYSRFSWNPNPAPLVSILMIYSTYRAWQGKHKYWLGVMTSFAVLLQLHYLTLLSLAGAGVVWLLAAQKNYLSKQLGQQIKFSLLGGLILLLSFTPLVLFDAKHNWLNIKAFGSLISGESNFKTAASGTLVDKTVKTLKETHGRAMHTLFEISIGQKRQLNTWLTIIVLAILGLNFKNKTKNKYQLGQVTIVIYLLTGILGTALYENTIFDHYIAYLFPVTFWTLGIVLSWFWQKKIWGPMVVIASLAYFTWFNSQRWPIHDAGWTIDDINQVSQTIYQRVEADEKYNLVLLSESRDIDGQNYRYFLTTTDRPPVKTQQRGEVETLFIINEERKVDEVVSDSMIYEIVTFPDKNIDEVYTAPGGPVITVLRTKNKTQLAD